MSGIKVESVKHSIQHFFEDYRQQSGVHGASRSYLQRSLDLALGREIASSVLNSIYGDVFVVPDGYFPKVGARVMSLQDPGAKMSKSDENDNAKIMLTDEPDAIIRKFKRAITDSGSEVL